jgi:DNA gyrase subunit A
VDPRRHALVVSQGGYGKRTPFDEYREQARGGIGIITYKVTPKTGSVVGLEVVEDQDELMLLTEQGVLIRIPVAPIRETGRSAQGVKLIDLANGDWVKTVSKIVRGEEEQPAEVQLTLLEPLPEAGGAGIPAVGAGVPASPDEEDLREPPELSLVE